MAKIRDPARDEAKKIYLENKGITNREIANRLNVDEKKIATWKYRDNWDNTSKKKNVVQQNKECSTTSKKKLLQKAKAMVISGSTIKAAAEETGVKESTLQNYSVKEKWIEKQKAFNQYLFNKLIEEKGEQHIERRAEAIEFLNYIQRKTMKKLGEDELLKDDAIVLERATNIVLKTMKGQAELLGMLDIKLSEKLENKTEEEKIQSSDRAIIVKVVD